MKKENIKLFVIISLMVVISLSATYAYVELSAGNGGTSGEGGCFEVAYAGDGTISNSSLQSSTEYNEEAYSVITLSKATGCDIYTEATISILTNSVENEAPIDDYQALKYRIEVTSGDGKILLESDGGTISEVTETTGVITHNKDANGNEIGLPLAKVKLTETTTTYKVYLWIDSAISQGQFNGKTYSGSIYASATQSSTIIQ